MMACGPRPLPRVAMATLSHLHSNLYIYVCLVPWCNSNPMTISGRTPLEVPGVAGNTQADDTLPSIGARGSANSWITPWPRTKLWRSPPPPRRGPPANS